MDVKLLEKHRVMGREEPQDTKEIDYLNRIIRESPELLCFRFTNEKEELPLKEYEKLVKKNLSSVNYASTPFGIYAFPYKHFFKEPPESLEEFFKVMSRDGVNMMDQSLEPSESGGPGESEEDLAAKRLLLLSKGGVLYFDKARYIRFIKIHPSARVWVLGENDPRIDHKSALSFSLGVIKSYLSGLDSRRSKALEYFVSLIFSRDRGYFPLFLLSSTDKILFTSLADVYDEVFLCHRDGLPLPLEEILFGMMLGSKKWVRDMLKVVYTLLSSSLAKAIDKQFFEATRKLEIEYENGEKYIDLPMVTLFFSLGLRLQTAFLNKDLFSVDENTLIKYICHHGGIENLSKVIYPRAYEKVRVHLKGAEGWNDEDYERMRDRLAYMAAKYYSISLFSVIQRISKDFGEEIDRLLPKESIRSSGYSKETYEKIVDSIYKLIESFYKLFLFFESLGNPIHSFPVSHYERYFNMFFENGYIFSKMYSLKENRKKMMELYRTIMDLGIEGRLSKETEEFRRIVRNIERRYTGVSRAIFEKYFFYDDLDINKASNYKKTKYLSKFIRSLGYDVVIDPGYGMIHPNEPIQMVILNDDVVDWVYTMRWREE